MSELQAGHLVKIGDSAYEVLYVTNPRRAVIRYDMGAVVCVDQGPDGKWDLSGQPASPEEQSVVEANMPGKDTTEVDVVKD